MSAEEKKRGWFGRLFGGDTPPAERQSESAAVQETGREAGDEAESEAAAEEGGDVALDTRTELASETQARLGEVPGEAADEAPAVAPAAPAETEADAEPEAIELETQADHGELAAREPEPEPTPPLTSDPTPAPAAAPVAKKSWFQRMREGLSRSSSALGQSITGLVRKRKLDDEMLQDLEDALIQADLGVETAMKITEELSARRYDKEVSADEVRAVLASEVEKVLGPVAKPFRPDYAHKPHVVLMVGVNGSGKTTTIGKMASKLRAEGRTVVMGAGDTFRAAAIEQLKVWGERTGATVVAKAQGSDASAVAWETIDTARKEKADIALIDTAGRLQNKSYLMDELTKIVRTIKKQDETAPHDVILVLDATTGQNAMQQVEIFRQVCGVTGLVMTKLDGTARGGILVAISAKHGLPVHAIGIGEGVEDLEAFDARDFARAIAGVADAAAEERA